jgi:rubrerythrin
MDIFAYAMKMELDGKNFYLQHAAQAPSPELKKILEELAGDEQKHYEIFKSLQEGLPTKYEEARQTKILSSIKNVFETLNAEKKDYAFPAEAQKVWEEAREIEKRSENFYREKANEVTNAEQKQILNRIADEEHKHWVTVENVIKFLDRPRHWLENAEWSHLEDY